LTVSCKRDEALDITNTEYISFKFSDEELSASGTVTKGTCDTLSYEITDWDYTGEESDTDVKTKGSLTESLSGEVGVFAAVGTTPVMNNAKHTVNGSELVPETKVLWKNYTSGTMKIFAYAPYKAGTTAETDASFTYTVANTISDQEDLLYATASRECTNRTAIPLAFKHGLTAIQFRMGFACKVKSITISKVKNSGKFYLDGSTPSVFSGSATYTLSYGDGKDVAQDSIVNKGNEMLILMPQAFDNNEQTISLTYIDGTGEQTIKATLNGTDAWPAGKKVTYTLRKKKTDDKDEYIYFDLGVGSIEITETTYSGWACCGEKYSSGYYEVPVKGEHKPSNKYYICQSTIKDLKNIYPGTGYPTQDDAANKTKFIIPSFDEIAWNGQKWGDYITNNVNVDDVEANWATAANNVGRVKVGALANKSGDTYYKDNSKRTRRPDYVVLLRGNSTFDITIDNLWSKNVSNLYGGINIGDPLGCEYNEKVIIRLKGDNKFHKILYNRPVNGYKGGSYTGSLTITSAEGDGVSSGTLTVTWPSDAEEAAKRENEKDGKGYLGGLIGAHGTNIDEDPEYGPIDRQGDQIFFKGGTIYVGSKKTSGGEWNGPAAPKNNNRCTIGGCNAYNNITISGGRLTAVSHSTSAAIGGGGGHNDPVGRSKVTITGGNVYAYSYPVYSTASKKMIPTTAIGGGSTSGLTGPYNSTAGWLDYTYSGKSDVTITGGNIYACSSGGSAIGGGNTSCRAGADASISITGGNVIAKSVEYHFQGPTKDTTLAVSTAIGGGSAGGAHGYKSGESGELDDTDHYDGGTATVSIGVSTILNSGSVGGGTTYWPNGKVGSAVITISGGQTSAQFIMAKGAKSAPTFTITDGFLNNSNTSDSEFVKIKENGGAVYMEDGTCNVNGGTIDKCSAGLGGAVYMNGGSFNMTGGTISNCSATTHGGAVYIDGGNATVSGGAIEKNLASAGNGGGVYVSAGNFTMPATSTGKINNNSADASSVSTDGNGGGIYVRSTTKNVNVDIIGGTVQYNAADRNGGGLCVDMDKSSYTATIRIGENDGPYNKPLISMNSAALSGGGMAVQGFGSNIYIYSGTVKGNVSAYVKNEDIRNDGGMVDLVGKNSPGVVDHVDVNYKTITFYANNGYDPEPYDEQRVITSTNSPLTPTATALAFEKEFYKKVSWNTKRDGSGVTYNLNGTGEVMNITSDLSLYAQWVENK